MSDPLKEELAALRHSLISYITITKLAIRLISLTTDQEEPPLTVSFGNYSKIIFGSWMPSDHSIYSEMSAITIEHVKDNNDTTHSRAVTRIRQREPKLVQLGLFSMGGGMRIQKYGLLFITNEGKIRKLIIWKLTPKYFPIKVSASQILQINVLNVSSDQKIVGNSLQPIGVIITGNLFIKAPCWELQQILLVSAARSRNKNFPVFCDMFEPSFQIRISINLTVHSRE